MDMFETCSQTKMKNIKIKNFEDTVANSYE